jgi:hypothetical protein
VEIRVSAASLGVLIQRKSNRQRNLNDAWRALAEKKIWSEGVPLQNSETCWLSQFTGNEINTQRYF